MGGFCAEASRAAQPQDEDVASRPRANSKATEDDRLDRWIVDGVKLAREAFHGPVVIRGQSAAESPNGPSRRENTGRNPRPFVVRAVRVTAPQ